VALFDGRVGGGSIEDVNASLYDFGAGGWLGFCFDGDDMVIRRNNKRGENFHYDQFDHPQITTTITLNLTASITQIFKLNVFDCKDFIYS